jgi:hypothetical protein
VILQDALAPLSDVFRRSEAREIPKVVDEVGLVKNTRTPAQGAPSLVEGTDENDSVILISRLGILPRGRGGTALAARYFGALREAEVRFAALSARSFCSD